jgi:Ser/Thr protein kinase RdoA (MazF antagonist)
MTFNDLDADQQLRRFASAARAALAVWTPGAEPQLRLISLRSNAVFAATFLPTASTAEFTMVLRVNWPGRKTLGAVEAELQRMDTLRRGGLPVPEVAYKAIAVHAAQNAPPMICTLFSYLDGDAVAPRDFSPIHAEAVGRVVAQMHAVPSAMPPRTGRPTFDLGGLFGRQSVYAVGAAGEALLGPHRPVLDAVIARVGAVFERLDALGDQFGFIHGDLKPDNMLFAAPDQPRILDFDDCGWGYSLYDLAPLLLFLRPPHPPTPSPSRGEGESSAKYQTLKAALWAGYTAVRPLPAEHFADLETLVAGRHVASCYWVAAHRDHPSYRGKADAILAERAARLAVYLESGAL